MCVWPVLGSEGKLFAPGNLRAVQDNPGYAELHKYYMDNKYQLRYTGGMVPDVNQILVKGKGESSIAEQQAHLCRLLLPRV